MAQRDEGLDRLEAFIAAAAQASSGLQREAVRLRGLSARIADEAGDVEARLEDLDQAIEDFDARYGDEVEIVLALAVAAYVGGAIFIGNPPLAPLVAIVVFLLMREFLHAQRPVIVEAADIALLAYRTLKEHSARLDETLEKVGEELMEAFETFHDVAAQAAAEPGALLEAALHGRAVS